MVQKIKIITSQDYESDDGVGNTTRFEEAVNNFIHEHNVIDTKYQANQTMTVNENLSNCGYFYSVMITYDESDDKALLNFDKNKLEYFINNIQFSDITGQFKPGYLKNIMNNVNDINKENLKQLILKYTQKVFSSSMKGSKIKTWSDIEAMANYNLDKICQSAYDLFNKYHKLYVYDISDMFKKYKAALYVNSLNTPNNDLLTFIQFNNQSQIGSDSPKTYLITALNFNDMDLDNFEQMRTVTEQIFNLKPNKYRTDTKFINHQIRLVNNILKEYTHPTNVNSKTYL